jgi:tetrapyrrole methylase family protein / MazG family protein
MPTVVVVGLGPGDPSLVTSDTLAAIQSTAVRFVRTAQHPSAHLVPNAVSFDDIYDSSDSFADVYATIATQIVTAAREHESVLYAVPGSPLILERTVALLRTHADITVRVHTAVSFLDEVWRALNIDPVEAGITLIDGHQFSTAAAGHTGPLLVAHTHANWVLSDIKLAIDEPDPTTPVILLHHLSLPDEQIINTTWAEMDHAINADHLTTLYIPQLGTPVAQEMAAFHQLARTLRQECPWDIEQTHQTLVRYLLEETYEVVDAIAQLDPNDPSTDNNLIEELGDVLYQIEFHAAIAEEEGRFSMADVARTAHEKLVARHPHVFGDVVVASAAEAEANWEAIKSIEKSERTGIFDGVVEASPSLSLAAKVQKRAARVGFDWPDLAGPLAKLQEEMAEVAQARATNDPVAIEAEVGDLLFTMVNVARHLDLDPETALRGAIRKFRQRIESVQELAAQRGLSMPDLSLTQLDELWEVVKQQPNH